MRDLVITFNNSETIKVSAFKGRLLLIAVTKLATCHAGWSVELIDEVVRLFDPLQVASVGCCTDCEPGQLIPDFPGRLTPVGWSPRPQVAQFLSLPISGFHLPKFVVVDCDGSPWIYVAQGSTGVEFVANFRSFVQKVMDHPPTAIGMGGRQ